MDWCFYGLVFLWTGVLYGPVFCMDWCFYGLVFCMDWCFVWTGVLYELVSCMNFFFIYKMVFLREGKNFNVEANRCSLYFCAL